MSGPGKLFKFFQVSDVHLDSKLASSRLALPYGKRQERNREIIEGLVSGLKMAAEREVDAVLMPGDLWDSESVTSQTLNRLIESLEALGSIPVIIAPGNHDFLSRDSLYSNEILSARGMRTWPENVHIFKTAEFSTFKAPGLEHVSFTGRAFTGNTPVSDRILAGAVPLDENAAINVLVFHGSLDGYRGGDSGWPGKVTAPFSVSEIAGLGFNYAAVGHYHDFTELRSGEGMLIGAYSGCMASRGLDESGPRYALIGSVASSDEEWEVSLEKVELDPRRIIRSSCDITGLNTEEIREEVNAVLEDSRARPERDIVWLHLEGRHPTGGEPADALSHLHDRFYHFVLEDESRPDYLTQKYDKRTTEGKFIQAMLDMKNQAESGDRVAGDTAYDVALTAHIIEDALYYGLDALKQGKIRVRNVD